MSSPTKMEEIELLADEQAIQQVATYYPNFLSLDDLPRLNETLYHHLINRMRGSKGTLFTIGTVNNSFWISHSPLQVFKGVNGMIFQFRKSPITLLILVFHTTSQCHVAIDLCLKPHQSTQPKLIIQQVQELDSIDAFLTETFVSTNRPSKISVTGDGDLVLFLHEFLLRTTQPPKIEDKLLKIMHRYRVYTLEDMIQLEPDMMRSLLHLPELKSIVQNCASFYLADRLLSAKKGIYEIMDNMESVYPGGDACKIIQFLMYQGVKPHTFIRCLTDVLNPACSKNLLLIYGTSGTGKSLFFRPLTKLILTGEYMEPVGFENCYDKDLYFSEHLLDFNSEAIPVFKRLAEGLPVTLLQSTGELRTLSPKPIVGITHRIPPHSDRVLAARMHMIQFPKPAKLFPFFQFCDHPSMICGRKDKDVDIDEIYWPLYLEQHQQCPSNCAHCSPILCHYERTPNNEKPVPQKSLYCHDHETQHHLQPVEPTDLLDTTHPCMRRSLRALKSDLNEEDTAACQITPQDWVSFFQNHVKQFRNTHEM